MRERTNAEEQAVKFHYNWMKILDGIKEHNEKLSLVSAANIKMKNLPKHHESTSQYKTYIEAYEKKADGAIKEAAAALELLKEILQA